MSVPSLPFGCRRTFLLATAGLLLLGACGQDSEVPSSESDAALPPITAAENSVVDLILSDERFSNLAAALDSTGLAATLQEEGPYTLFAPPDEVFPQSLLAPDNRAALRALLQRHIVEGRLTAQDLRNRPSVSTLAGDRLGIAAAGEPLRVGGAAVLEAGFEAANGIVHVVDAALVPGSGPAGTSPAEQRPATVPSPSASQ